jgi:hypothetical protein
MANGSEKRFWVKDHGEVLAVCDKELLGKTVEGIKINERLYKGELLDEKELKEKLKSSKNINLFGKKCIGLAIELKMAEKDNCIMFGDVPHMNMVCI